MGVEGRKRQGVNVIIPGLLYQRGHFLTWTYEQKQTLLEDLGVSVVVNLWHRVDPDLSRDIPGTVYLNYPMSPSAMPSDLAAIEDLLARLLSAGHVTLIHCEAGKGRSVWLSTRLLARQLGIPKAQAWALVKQVVPGYRVHGPLLADLT
jgi:protein-tyrosine phosphatase